MNFSQSEIISYYDSCEIDYRIVWNLDESQALHYGFWEEDVSDLSQALDRQNQWLARQGSIGNGSRILDAGCGVGGSSIYLAKRLNCQVSGVSISENQIHLARENAKKAGVEQLVDFHVCDYKNTGYQAESFDYIWAIESVCHIANKNEFITEAWRLLKPGGKLIIADGFYSRPEKRFTPKELKLMQSWLHPWAVSSLVTPDEFQNLLLKQGFDESKIESVDTTRLIKPSSQLLNRHAIFSWIPGHLMRWMKLRNQSQHRNLIAARRQWQALKNELWLYYVFIAEKSIYP
ncbi:methyltransferase domain-containing protein [Leptospira sp. 96542]|nr:methyltransferase domain-containing protein [Leptospira sp. 96542]